MHKQFCFTVDDNIRFLKELTQGAYDSAFAHPYLAMYRRLHEKHGLCVQLNLFYELGDFTLASVTDRFKEEFARNSDWLKMSFHSRLENVRPYENAGYDEVYTDCNAVQGEIVRFASREALAKTTTLHFCLATEEGLRAMRDTGTKGLLGLYGTKQTPRLSYQTKEREGARIRHGETVTEAGIAYAGIDIVLNLFSKEENIQKLRSLLDRSFIKVMIHEQYFYPDYPLYQADFEEKLDAVFTALGDEGYQSTFFENTLSQKENR